VSERRFSFFFCFSVWRSNGTCLFETKYIGTFGVVWMISRHTFRSLSGIKFDASKKDTNSPSLSLHPMFVINLFYDSVYIYTHTHTHMYNYCPNKTNTMEQFLQSPILY
jgi:hypothetical protein